MDNDRKNNILTKDALLREVEELRRKNAALKQFEFECSRYKSLLKESEQKFYLLVHNLPDIIYLLDEHGNISFISNAIQEYGYSPEKLVGTSIIDIVHPDDRSKALYRVNERRRGNRRTKLMEVRFVAKNDAVIPLELKSREVKDFPVFSVSAEGQYVTTNGDVDVQQFIGTLGVARDVSHRPQDTGSFEIGQGLIPICSSCKNIRDKMGHWVSPETYFKRRAGVGFTHSICPDCAEKVKRPE